MPRQPSPSKVKKSNQNLNLINLPKINVFIIQLLKQHLAFTIIWAHGPVPVLLEVDIFQGRGVSGIYEGVARRLILSGWTASSMWPIDTLQHLQ